MSFDIRNVRSADDLIRYFAEELRWDIDLDNFDTIDDITYDFDAADVGLKEEAFAKISSLKQLQPLVEGQKWGIFCVEFDSSRFEVSALRKILSGLIPKRRNAAEHAVWEQKDLLFLCFWGQDNNRTIGIAHFEDKETGLPQIKMISCAPAVEDFTQINIFTEKLKHLTWVKDDTNTAEWHEKWSAAFTTAYHQVIHDSASLTVKLAAEAQAIRDRILAIYEVESEDGYVHKLHKDFRESLIHDMDEKSFADMYAQTVVYGLFSARCMDKTQQDFSVQEAIDCIPETNPFLKSLMKECLGGGSDRKLSFDELEVANVVDILLHTNTEQILQDFNRQTGGGKEDPVIHFYEEFLTAYDKGQKVQRGVYYTPQPVVNFIVRAVDSILKTEFGLADGLASEETKEILAEVEGKKRRERFTVPAVQILDPATGTGTFLRQTIIQIYENFKEKHKGENDEQIKKAWNAYVPKHLLPRLNGFELMMAPYAVAHMKLAMVLKDTGYDFGADTRLNVFLTNSLEEAGNTDMQMSFFEDDPLASESVQANQAKKNNGINVIIGNPPYSVESSNKGEWISELMKSYKFEPNSNTPLQERNSKVINDDYVKFIRYAQRYIESAGNGILAYICPHGFIANPTFRGMRWNLLKCFDIIYVLDLNGNARKIMTGGFISEKDENVFDIMQGVAIAIFVKMSDKKENKKVYNRNIIGNREYKYNLLNSNNLNDIDWNEISPTEPFYTFNQVNGKHLDNFYNFISLKDLFGNISIGIVTGDDTKFVFPQKDDIHNDIYSYRLFDNRYINYDPGQLQRARHKTMQHMLKDNFALCVGGTAKNTNPQSIITTNIACKAYLTSETYVIPLYQYNEYTGVRFNNINEDLATKLLKHINVEYNDDMALNIFDYIYAVCYSSKYLVKYKDYLKMDFPRVPYPTDKELFRKLVALGSQLRECHLMKTELDTSAYTLSDGSGEVVKPEYKDGKVYISKTQYFDNVPQAQWEQYIGGYQPLQKWLKDRKKTTLSAEDAEHYKKIIAALKRTEEIMGEIDTVFDV